MQNGTSNRTFLQKFLKKILRLLVYNNTPHVTYYFSCEEITHLLRGTRASKKGKKFGRLKKLLERNCLFSGLVLGMERSLALTLWHADPMPKTAVATTLLFGVMLPTFDSYMDIYIGMKMVFNYMSCSGEQIQEMKKIGQG